MADSGAYDDDYTAREKVVETESGYTIAISSTRGTDTRDEDFVKVVGRAESWTELDAQRDDLHRAAIEELRRLREFQPDDDILSREDARELAVRVDDAKSALSDGEVGIADATLTHVLDALTADEFDPDDRTVTDDE